MLIPSIHVVNSMNLSWNDVLWAYQHQKIGWSTVVDIAVSRLSAKTNDPLEIELAGIQKSKANQVGELLQKLALKDEENNPESSKRKWLYLTLAFLFKNQKDITQFLDEIELVYADFGYPKEVSEFVRYMPIKDDYNPQHHNKIENEKRLVKKWREYLVAVERQLASKNGFDS